MATEKVLFLWKVTIMTSDVKSRYYSLDLHVPEDLKQAFIDGFDEVGLHAGVVHCFSAKPTSIKEYLSVIFERGKTYAPLVLKVLDMLQRKHSIKIEVSANRKIVELSGVSTDDALKLIEAANTIQVSHNDNVESPGKNTKLRD